LIDPDNELFERSREFQQIEIIGSGPETLTLVLRENKIKIKKINK